MEFLGKIIQFIKGKLVFSGYSRLKKKLMLYFILISIVSISVSLEMILEVSEGHFRKKLAMSLEQELRKHLAERLKDYKGKSPLPCKIEDIDLDKAFYPLEDMKIRMILLLLVILMTIITAFILFSKDIANPIDAVVAAAKKISEGDLSVTVPVLTQDEIGQLAKLLNEMNINLQELVAQIRFGMERVEKQLSNIQGKVSLFLQEDKFEEILRTKRLKVKDFKILYESIKEVIDLLARLSGDLKALTTFINMYKIYQVNQEQEQNSGSGSKDGEVNEEEKS